MHTNCQRVGPGNRWPGIGRDFMSCRSLSHLASIYLGGGYRAVLSIGFLIFALIRTKPMRMGTPHPPPSHQPIFRLTKVLTHTNCALAQKLAAFGALSCKCIALGFTGFGGSPVSGLPGTGGSHSGSLFPGLTRQLVAKICEHPHLHKCNLKSELFMSPAIWPFVWMTTCGLLFPNAPPSWPDPGAQPDAESKSESESDARPASQPGVYVFIFLLALGSTPPACDNLMASVIWKQKHRNCWCQIVDEN